MFITLTITQAHTKDKNMGMYNDFPRQDERIVDVDENAASPDRRLRVALGSILSTGLVFRAVTQEEMAKLNPAFIESVRQSLGMAAVEASFPPVDVPEPQFEAVAA